MTAVMMVSMRVGTMAAKMAWMMAGMRVGWKVVQRGDSRVLQMAQKMADMRVELLADS